MEDLLTAMNVKIRFFSGDTLQQALVQAANHFQLAPEQIAYRSIEKKHGFLKTRRKVVIEVDPEAPQRTVPVAQAPAAPVQPPARTAPVPAPAPEAAPALPMTPAPRPPAAPEVSATPAPRPVMEPLAPQPTREPRREPGERQEPGRPERPAFDRPERAPRPEPLPRAERSAGGEEGLVTLPERPRSPGERFPVAEGPAAEAAQKGITLLLEVSGLDLGARVLRDEEERLVVELSGKDADRCFEDEGEILLAFEHLLPRIIRTLSGESVLCRVDCENFHEIREEQLRTLAQRIAGEVRLRQRSRTLEPMNPADRRVVHMTLADDPNVVTESEGEGYFKRVTIRPA
jgi:spoIIIJ-associated protein